MSEKTALITETNGKYKIENKGISEFALLGILECIVFDMKNAERKQLPAEFTEPGAAGKDNSNEKRKEVSEQKQTEQEIKREAAQSPNTPELRTRISNAVKAVKELGGKVEDTDFGKLTDDQLQKELEELTAQYKRLKSLKAAK